MKKWQWEHITKNRANLIQNTICNNLLLETMASRNILSQSDIQQINCAKGSHAKASQFYNILLTRVNSYFVLVDALSETKQSGAEKILLQNCIKTLRRLKNGLYYDSWDCNSRLQQSEANCTVWKGTFGLHPVAVKKESLDLTSAGKQAAKQFFKQAKMLSKIDHHINIIRFFDSEVERLDQGACHVVTAYELCQWNLTNWVNTKKRAHGNTAKMQFNIIKQITSGIEYLHNNKIVHLNLRPSTVLINEHSDENVCIKITNFTNADYVNGSGRCSLLYKSVGKNKEWMPKEILRKYQTLSEGQTGNYSVGFHTDIFSLGCLIYYVLSNGEHPFGSLLLVAGNIVLENFSAMKLKKRFCKGICSDCSKNAIEKMILKKGSRMTRVSTTEMSTLLATPNCRHKIDKWEGAPYWEP